MFHTASMTRAALIVIPTLCLLVGCKPVADTTDTPLPTQAAELDDASTDEPTDTEPTITVPAETDADNTEPTITEPTITEPTDKTAAEARPADTVASDTVAADNEASEETDELTDDGAANVQVTDDIASDQEATDMATLTIGSVAPPIQISQWVKGDPVDDFTAGRVYVVEFWATWCGPCRTSMPHISQLQTDLNDSVTFIGVTQEDEETVQAFMAKVQDEESGKTWDEVVQYTIALDSESATSNAYMRAAEQGGIPTAFIVGKDGCIEWIGHPMSIDDPIAKIVVDQWDREVAAAKFDEDRAVKRAYEEVNTVARRAKQTGDWTEAIQMVEKIVLKNPDSAAFKIMQFNLLLVAEKYDDVNRLADELSNQVWDDADYLNRIAWQVVTRVPEDQRNLDLALKIALRAGELAERNPSVLDTVARVYFEKGDREAAIEWQKRAVEAAPHTDGLRQTLEKYEAENQETE